MSSYFNFCNNWGEFGKFDWYVDDTKWGKYFHNHKYYPCGCVYYFQWWKWQNQFESRDGILKFNDIWIDRDDKFEPNINLRDMESKEKLKKKIDIIHQVSSVDITDKYSCQIWFNLVDVAENLQCSYCQRIFWFYCLIDWLKTGKKSWPNWRKIIHSKDVFVNKCIERELNLMISIINKNKEIEWKIHQRIWDIYWQTWSWEVCGIWIVNEMHIGHKICSIENQKDQSIILAKNLICSDNLPINTKSKEIERLKDNMLLTWFIKDEQVKKIKDKIDSIENELTQKITETHLQFSNQIKSEISEWKEEEKILNEFVENKDNNILLRSIEAINTIRKKNEEAIELIHKIENTQIEPVIIASETPIAFVVNLEKDKLINSNDNPFTLNLLKDDQINKEI